MKVLFILEYYHPHTGGVETFFRSLIQELDRQGHSITVITNRYHKDLPKVETRGNNITVKRYGFLNRYLFTFGAWWYAMKDARDADLIHTTSFNAAVPARIAARWTNTKSIITFHEVWGDLWFRLPWMSQFSARLHRAFEKWICSFHFDRFVGVSDFTKNALLQSGISPGKVRRIYNGIEYPARIQHTGSNPEDPFIFLFFGRVSYSKGVDLLIPAVRQLKKSNSNFKLILIIPSEQTSIAKDIRSQIAQFELNDVIVELNDLPYSELENQIVKSDAVVIPSYSEGFCFAAAETMAIGTPIISSGQGALKEVVNGKHIEFDLSIEGLTQAMDGALQDQWTITPTKQFPLSDTIDQYLQLYQELT